MDLTPDLLLEAKFAPARRGYDMNEVDDFLERCAEGLDVLLARLRAEFDRAERAEAALVELRASGGVPAVDGLTETVPIPDTERVPEPQAEAVPAPSVAPEPEPERVQEPMRILIAAERTAEAAIADARAEAERIRAEAESVASTTRSEAETLLARSRAEAEAEARKAGDDARRSIEAEVLALRQDRDVLSQDVRSLRTWLDDQRGRLRTAARDLQRLVDDPDALGELPEPDVHADSELTTSAGDDADPAPAIEAASDPDDDADAPPPTSAGSDDVVDARSRQDVGRLGGAAFEDEPTQAVPTIDTSARAGVGIFDDEQASSGSSFFGSDTIR